MTPPPDNDLPDIPGFRILQELGAGGMGTVYLAEQREPVRRRVALKVVKLGMDSKQVLARFEVERQALAVMSHDGIAKVFEAGTTARGQPYFVMEHVPGVPLTQYCDQNRLTVPERLELFCRICDAVQHAHQRGVIHRDLKPGNVLVTAYQGKAAPKIIDFGLARATDQHMVEQTLFTELGQIIGTPEYMSPEQAEMSSQDIDVRTDVYSLGVVLYELLVGALPFPARELREAGLLEIQRRIREDEPPRPSTRLSTLDDDSDIRARQRGTTTGALGKRLRGELDWVVMRALEKDKSRRYATAEAFAEDIQRHLRDEPVEARPPSALYRIGKMLRRHRRAVGTLAAVAVAVGGITAYFVLRDADRETTRAAEMSRLRDGFAERERELEREKAALADQAKVLSGKLAATTKQLEARRAQWDARLAEIASKTEELARLAQQKARGEEGTTLGRKLAQARSDLAKFQPVTALAARIEAVRRATVRVEASMQVRDSKTGKYLHVDTDGVENFEGRGKPFVRRTAGSGLVLSADGWVVTSADLVRMAASADDRLGVEARVTVINGAARREASVRATRTTANASLVLLELSSNEGEPLPFVDRLAFDRPLPRPHEQVYLTECGAATSGPRVFQGILSRHVQGFLQINAAVHPHSAGGALTDDTGEVIGIVMYAQQLPDGTGRPAIGYAVPIAELRHLWPRPRKK